jgi:hypothetical protein
VTNCHKLKMLATDGKMRMTEAADIEQLFRKKLDYHIEIQRQG